MTIWVETDQAAMSKLRMCLRELGTEYTTALLEAASWQWVGWVFNLGENSLISKAARSAASPIWVS